MSALEAFHPAVRDWFQESFPAPTRPQEEAWPAICRGESTLVVAPTGTGKTLAAFLYALERLLFQPVPDKARRCRILYVSPLKALAVDVERNLRAPLAGIARLAQSRQEAVHDVEIALRTGDTPGAARERFRRQPADILITTPESLYLLLTSRSADALRSVEAVILDEIHALVPTKRGAHLALSLERLEAAAGHPLQRIGLSATARPLPEIARFVGGTSRRVTIVDTGERKKLDLTVDVPVEDMARVSDSVDPGQGPAPGPGERSSIWTAIHPRLLSLVREHQTTLIFVNSRRLAERLSAALNELAGEPLVLAHHGSLALPQRREVEEKLKAGLVRGLVATSSLELGIDMAAVDLVVQIECPPSVASGMQRIGRGGHTVDASSRGILFPKHRGDLLSCAAVARAMRLGEVELLRCPQNPLDVLAQQLVAMVSSRTYAVDDLYDTVRRAAPFSDLPRGLFDDVLDLLSGRYPSDDFSELRPRVTWDRIKGEVQAREGARRIAILNGGTIPDRGYYPVFLAGAKPGTGRVGELDEEMVFESRPGETFLLGASSWRIEEITHDRVLVSPAAGEPGKMPFWKGDGLGRSVELGKKIGSLVRTLRSLPPPRAQALLEDEHDLDAAAARNLLRYLDDQASASGEVPDDETVLIERCRDELGDYRVCVLTPFGTRVHAPWALAVTARILERTGLSVETMWTDDGFVVRYPDSEEPPSGELFVPEAESVQDLVVRQLSSTAQFAARFRESAARALLLPRRRAAARTPLWQQRKRASDLLAVASRYSSFPILLESYRECLTEAFDMPALYELLSRIGSRRVRVRTCDSTSPSPFAASVLFGYIANYLYDGDAPLPERRAQALAIDQAQLKELLGDVDLRDVLDRESLEEVEAEIQARTEKGQAQHADQVHDLLLRLGALSLEDLEERSGAGAHGWVLSLLRSNRIVEITLRSRKVLVAAEDAARYRDGLGVPLPMGLPAAFLEKVADPRGDLVKRYARTHGPFTTEDLAAGLGIDPPSAEEILRDFLSQGVLLQGAFRPQGRGLEWCDAQVLRQVRRRSLARLRREVEPTDSAAYARMLLRWQGVSSAPGSLDRLLDAIECLQGAPLPASALESEILPARVRGYRPSDLDSLLAAGEVVWVGVEPLGERDGRVALFLTDHLRRLFTPQAEAAEIHRSLIEYLRGHGATFFSLLHEAAGGGYPGSTIDALWDLVWKGIVTNDTLSPLRSLLAPAERTRFRSRRTLSPLAQGRWSLVESRLHPPASPTEKAAALAQQLLRRYGVVTKEAARSEAIPGGFSAVYPLLQKLEETGRIRRGLFVAGLGAAQFAEPAAVDLLRSLREGGGETEAQILAATDPANPYGALLPWPEGAPTDSPLGRFVSAFVVLLDGRLAAFGRETSPNLAVFQGDRSSLEAVARALSARGERALLRRGHRGILISQVNGSPAHEHPLGQSLEAAGFVRGSRGYHRRRARVPA